MRKVLHLALSVGAAGFMVVIGASGAQASCHSFTIGTVTPNPVAEGGKVTVTVERDAGVDDSHVRISTVTGSAIQGSDFTALNTVVNFTNGNTTKNVSVQTTNDAAMEGAETFKLHLSDGGGCQINPNFMYGPDKTVTIKASDQVIQQPTAQPTAVPTAASTAQATATASPSPSPSPSVSPSATPTFTPFPSITPIPDEGGLSGLAIAGIILGAGAVGSAGAVWYFRRRAGG